MIAGGASGMGEGTVRRFVQEGAQVVIGDIQDAKGHTLADTLPVRRCISTSTLPTRLRGTARGRRVRQARLHVQ